MSKYGFQNKILKYDFKVDYCDHFETSLEAYKDITQILEQIAKNLKKQKSELVIYDPFFCQGTVIQRLKSLGFNKVINENKDFYKSIKYCEVPFYDVLMTNPPYSEDHKEKILDFCISSGKPWLLLLPNYISTKNYFKKSCENLSCQPFFVVPNTRYEYEHPHGTGHEKSPFFSIWIANLQDQDSQNHFILNYSNQNCQIVSSVSELMEKNIVPNESRPNPKQRKKLKNAISKDQQQLCKPKSKKTKIKTIIQNINGEIIKKKKKRF